MWWKLGIKDNGGAGGSEVLNGGESGWIRSAMTIATEVLSVGAEVCKVLVL